MHTAQQMAVNVAAFRAFLLLLFLVNMIVASLFRNSLVRQSKIRSEFTYLVLEKRIFPFATANLAFYLHRKHISLMHSLSLSFFILHNSYDFVYFVLAAVEIILFTKQKR